METDGTLPELGTNDDILKFVNDRIELDGLKFIGVKSNKDSNLRFESNLPSLY